jgi:hypothetical protein
MALEYSAVRKVVIEEWLAVSSSLVGSTASHPTYYNLPYSAGYYHVLNAWN